MQIIKATLGLIAFFALYAGADWLGGHMPFWTGALLFIALSVVSLWAIARLLKELF